MLFYEGEDERICGIDIYEAKESTAFHEES
jgi:hypothetical protein